MGTATRILGVLVFALFVSVIALRPLVANPAIAGAFRDGLGTTGLLVVLPLLLVTVLVVVLRVRSLLDEDDPHDEQFSAAEETRREEAFWEEREDSAGTRQIGGPDTAVTDTSTGEGDRNDGAMQGKASESSAMSDGRQNDEDGNQDGGGGKQNDEDGEQDGEDGKQDGEDGDAGADENSESNQPMPDILSGQGGAREREFEIEEEPPDAMLSEHLEHLQQQLDDDETVREDLETLEEVAAETEGDRTIPARCPQPHCNAVWTGRTVLGVGTERYELLADGTRVQCLNCEEIHRLEE